MHQQKMRGQSVKPIRYAQASRNTFELFVEPEVELQKRLKYKNNKTISIKVASLGMLPGSQDDTRVQGRTVNNLLVRFGLAVSLHSFLSICVRERRIETLNPKP